jgi:hypothetical protein
VPGTKQQLWRSIPESDDDRIEISKRFQRRVEQSGEPHVGNLHPSSLVSLAHDEDIRWLQISVEDPVLVKIVDPIEDLVEQALDHSFGNHHCSLGSFRGAMELDDVPQVVFSVVEQQPNLPVSMREENSDEVDHVGMFQLAEKRDFTARRHRQAGPLDLLQRVVFVVVSFFAFSFVDLRIVRVSQAAGEFKAFNLRVWLLTEKAKI